MNQATLQQKNDDTVEQCTRLFIYSVHSVWFRLAIYKNAVLFSYCTGAVSGGYRR